MGSLGRRGTVSGPGVQGQLRVGSLGRGTVSGLEVQGLLRVGSLSRGTHRGPRGPRGPGTTQSG